MTREQEIRTMLEQLFARYKADLAGHRVLLFGSRSQGTARAHSDFDVAVDGQSPMALSTFYKIADELEALPTLYRFDWVDLAAVNEKFRQEALKTAQVIREA